MCECGVAVNFTFNLIVFLNFDRHLEMKFGAFLYIVINLSRYVARNFLITSSCWSSVL